MKTKLCRPVLVENKDFTTIVGWKNKIELINNSISQLVDKYYELILISLDPDEKIKVGDKYYDEHNRLVLTATTQSDHNVYHYKKVIAAQSQLSPEYIQQFIEEYNKGEVKDVEIEMEELYFYGSGYYKSEELSQIEREGLILMREFKPKLTNGFITIAEKSNIEKQADLVEEIAFENLKVKEPITYTEEEVLEYLNNLNDLLEEKTIRIKY